MNQALTRIVDNEDKDVQQQTSETNLWTVRQVAEKFNVSEQTIRRDIKAEVLPHLRIRGCIRLPKQVVLDWVEAQTRYNWRCVESVLSQSGDSLCDSISVKASTKLPTNQQVENRLDALLKPLKRE